MTELDEAFATYFEEIERCTAAKCYWSLLHVLVVLPAVCASLEKADGDGGDYPNWCKRYFDPNTGFAPTDRYALRCALVHQGRTTAEDGQYGSYSFMQPTPSGDVLHFIVRDIGDARRPNFTLDIGQMATETVRAVRRWFADLAKPERAPLLANVRQNIRWLARQGQAPPASL